MNKKQLIVALAGGEACFERAFFEDASGQGSPAIASQ